MVLYMSEELIIKALRPNACRYENRKYVYLFLFRHERNAQFGQILEQIAY